MQEKTKRSSLTAHWHDKGADWRGLAHSPAHRRSRLSDSVKNGNAFRTVHNAALPARKEQNSARETRRTASGGDAGDG